MDKFSDGDHEDCRKKDIPSTRRVNASWQEYYRCVAKTGKDPLNAFVVQTTKGEKWQYEFRRWIGEAERGAMFVRARKSGRGEWKTEGFPKELIEYLHLDGKVATGVTCDKIVSVKHNNARWIRGGMGVRGWARIKVPRTESAIRNETIKCARRAICQD